jgi:four helix bundle protein
LEGGRRVGRGLLFGNEGFSKQRSLRNDLSDAAVVRIIAANIAEGHGRESTGSFIQFLRMAQGSLKELETHLIVSGKVGLMVEAEVVRLLSKADEIGKMLRSMIRSLQQKS